MKKNLGRTMNRSKMSILSYILILIALLATVVLKTGTARATSSFHCGTWNVVPSPSPGVSQNHLYGVKAISTKNVWAVGGYGDSDHGYTLTEHWNGSSWSVVSSPNPGSFNELNAVTRVPGTNQLWAAGDYNSHTRTLIEHWDGTNWSMISSPNFGLSYNYLAGITAVTANDIWAVGYDSDIGSSPRQTLIEHWDGSSWSVVSSPNIGSLYNILYGVTAVSASDIWAVGIAGPASSGASLTLIEHWNGTSWSVVSSPNPGQNNVTYGVAAISTNNAWAVGSYSYASNTLIEHWNGSSWSVVSSPSPGSLVAVARVPGTHGRVWAVGTYSTQTLTEFYC